MFARVQQRKWGKIAQNSWACTSGGTNSTQLGVLQYGWKRIEANFRATLGHAPIQSLFKSNPKLTSKRDAKPQLKLDSNCGPNAWPQTTFCHQTLSQSKPSQSGRPASQPSNMDTPSQMLSYDSNRQLFSNGNLTLNTSFPNTLCTLPCNVVQSEGAQSARSVHTAQCNTANTRGEKASTTASTPARGHERDVVYAPGTALALLAFTSSPWCTAGAVVSLLIIRDGAHTTLSSRQAHHEKKRGHTGSHSAGRQTL